MTDHPDQRKLPLFTSIPRARNTEHTPAPWVVNTPPDTYLCVYSKRPDGGLDRHICGDVDSWPNARLIAAAPDLLAALRDLLPSGDPGWWCRNCVAETDATYDERCSACGEPFGEPTAEVDAIRAARAAIAKAEGGSDDQ